MSPFPAWVIFHVPHDSLVIPASLRKQFVLSDDELAAEVIRMTDHHTLDLFTAGVPEEQIIGASVSRLVIDVERFEDDSKEPMSVRGMGVVYNRTSDGRDLRHPLSASERQKLIDVWYRPHHEHLTTKTQQVIDQYGFALLLDAHSFSSKPMPHEPDQRSDRPEICIGTDEYHTSKDLESTFMNAFRDDGFDVRLNAPFAGALVPMRHFHSDKRVAAVMVEINRALYIDESTSERNGEFKAIANRIHNCLMDAIHNSRLSETFNFDPKD